MLTRTTLIKEIILLERTLQKLEGMEECYWTPFDAADVWWFNNSSLEKLVDYKQELEEDLKELKLENLITEILKQREEQYQEHAKINARHRHVIVNKIEFDECEFQKLYDEIGKKIVEFNQTLKELTDTNVKKDAQSTCDRMNVNDLNTHISK